MKLLYNKDHDIVGVIYGILFPVVSYALLSLFKDYGLILSKEFVGIICVGSNLSVFYYYINRHFYRSVRGVVIVTIIWAVIYIIQFKIS